MAKFKSYYDTPMMKKMIRNDVKPADLAADLNATKARVNDLLQELPGDKRVIEMRKNINGLMRFFEDLKDIDYALYRDRSLSLIQAQLNNFKATIDKLEK